MTDQLELVDPEGRSLAELAQLANAEYKLAREAVTDAVRHAVNCGLCLNAAKVKVQHGEWLPWLADNFDGVRQTAADWMRLATKCSEDTTFAPRSIESGLQAIATAKAAGGAKPISKPDVGGGVSHPARYSDEILRMFADSRRPAHRRGRPMIEQATLFDEPPTGAVRHSDPQTSRDAAARISGRTERLILDVFARLPDGLTDDQLARLFPHLHAPTVKTARSRLSNKGALIDSGTTRLSARGCPMIVWTRP